MKAHGFSLRLVAAITISVLLTLQPSHSTPEPTRGNLVLRKSHSVIRFELSPRTHGMLLVRGKFGPRPAILILDTGSYTTVDPDWYKVSQDRVRPLPAIAVDPPERLSGYYIGSVAVGEAYWTKTPVLLLKMRDIFDFGPSLTPAGILGIDKMSFLAVKIDYPRSQITFSDVRDFRVKKGTVPIVKPLLNRGLLCVRAMLDGVRPIVLRIDTGIGISSLSPSIASTYPPATRAEEHIIQDLRGFHRMRFVQCRSLRIGGNTLRHPILATETGVVGSTAQEEGVDGILGNDLLRHFQVEICPEKAMVTFTAPTINQTRHGITSAP
jgi:hypothetical protein